VRTLGFDETASCRGQNYITLVHDLDRQRLLFGCPWRDQETVTNFAEDFQEHNGDPKGIEAVCIDMSKAYIKGVGKEFPDAEITFDPFHIIKLANEALDEVRREEVKQEPILRKTRWIWLKDQAKWTSKQCEVFHALPKAHLKTTRAWQLKETLRGIFQESDNSREAATGFDA